jgi:predicted metal-dependent HD superfamily phosphohydrolase
MSSLLSVVQPHYDEPHRAYHNLTHIYGVYNELLACRDEIKNWDAVYYAVWFHDVIYDPMRHDNELQSALFAEQYLLNIGFSNENIKLVKKHILATQGHHVSDNHDTNLLTDADLAILGSTPTLYRQYAAQIRAEYNFVPPDDYRKGRTQVLQHFLSMPRLFEGVRQS